MNPQAINPSDIKTPPDLLKPKYVGKIGALNPLMLVGHTFAGVILRLKGPNLTQLDLGQKVDHANDPDKAQLNDQLKTLLPH